LRNTALVQVNYIFGRRIARRSEVDPEPRRSPHHLAYAWCRREVVNVAVV